VSILLGVGATSSTIGPVLITDLVEPRRLGWGMSLFNGAIWLGVVAAPRQKKSPAHGRASY
jgi:hypothetical protein